MMEPIARWSYFIWCFMCCPCLFLQLILEGVRARQSQEIMLIEKQTLEKEVQQANASLVLYEMKAARIEDQVIWASCRNINCGDGELWFTFWIIVLYLLIYHCSMINITVERLLGSYSENWRRQVTWHRYSRKHSKKIIGC